MVWWVTWFLMFCMTIGSCSRCKIVVIKCHLLQFEMLRGKMANSPTCPSQLTPAPHFFMRVEREGDWILQQHCLGRMLPNFFVTGHHHYARYIIWHLRDMQHIPPDANHDPLNGSHVCRHIDRAAAVSGDQYGEQTYITQRRTSRGLKSTSTNPEQVAV